MDDYIDVKINVFEHTDQRVRIRRSITVRTLIDEILKEFDDVDATNPEKYSIKVKGVDKQLDINQTLAQLDIQPQDELTLAYLHPTIRRMIEPQHRASLCEEKSKITFEIQWTPAVIGRPSTEVNHNILLAVNLQLLAIGMTISRKHAQILFSDGAYFIQPLAKNNPTFLNGKPLAVNSMNKLNSGDQLSFGTRRVNFTFTTRMKSVRKPHEAPGYQPPSQANEPSQTPLVTPSRNIASLLIEKSLNPANIGMRIDVQSIPFVMGRILPVLSSEGDISRQHAEINYDLDRKVFTIRDLNSTNGVTLNGSRITAAQVYELQQGTRIGLGKIMQLVFEIG